MWDGINYLLKMPSDLDYLDGYVAIKNWMGFPLTRNPFCVPYPMDAGSKYHTGMYIAFEITICIIELITCQKKW